MSYRISLALIVLLVSGCASHTRPSSGSPDLQAISGVEITGTFGNNGDPEGHLSSAFWPGGILVSIHKTVLYHRDIDRVQIESSENGFRVNAISGSCIIAQRTLESGVDYSVNENEIVLIQKGAALNRGAGDVVVGPSRERTTLSFDSNGNAVVHNSGFMAGMAFLIVPVAASRDEQALFLRETASGNYELCRSS